MWISPPQHLIGPSFSPVERVGGSLPKVDQSLSPNVTSRGPSWNRPPSAPLTVGRRGSDTYLYSVRNKRGLWGNTRDPDEE